MTYRPHPRQVEFFNREERTVLYSGGQPGGASMIGRFEMSFGDALRQLRIGNKVARSGWNGKGMYLYLIEDWLPMTQRDVEILHLPRVPFIAMKTADDKVVPWLASQTDILATDWELAS